jgi:hypothetical protein
MDWYKSCAYDPDQKALFQPVADRFKSNNIWYIPFLQIPVYFEFLMDLVGNLK